MPPPIAPQSSPPQAKKKKWLPLFFLHRYVGLTAAFFAITLSVTGILLNHTEEFSLNKHHATTSWLLAMYGIKAPEIDTAYPLQDSWVVELGDSIYWQGKSLNCKPPLTGAYVNEELMLISNAAQICLFTHKSELIDYLTVAQGVTINRLGILEWNKQPSLVVETSNGLYHIDPDYTHLIPMGQDTPRIEWHKPVPAAVIPKAITSSLNNAYKGEGLPWERVILDLHSGRIVGLAGVYFMDVIALLIIFLAITGVMMWLKRRRRKSR